MTYSNCHLFQSYFYYCDFFCLKYIRLWHISLCHSVVEI